MKLMSENATALREAYDAGVDPIDVELSENTKGSSKGSPCCELFLRLLSAYTVHHRSFVDII
jgi:hypothetical protein